METFGEFVAKRRRKLGMTQAELAKRSRLSPGTIGDIEQGTQHATRNIDLLAKALELTVDELRNCRLPAETSPPPLSLDSRETHLLEKFRSLSERDKQRLEDFLGGIRSARRGPRRLRPPPAMDRRSANNR